MNCQKRLGFFLSPDILEESVKRGIMMDIDDKVPNFKFQASNDLNSNLSAYKGQWLVIYFYPKNFTPGCTAEACSFRDQYEDFKDLGAEVMGISSDSANSHTRFVKRYKLPYTMVSDTGGKIRKKYGVKGDLMGLLPGRETFVIDKNGTILMRFHSMQATKHIDKALTILKNEVHGA